jgi:hypothetical protein
MVTVKDSEGLLRGGWILDMASFRNVFVLILIPMARNDEFTLIETEEAGAERIKQLQISAKFYRYLSTKPLLQGNDHGCDNLLGRQLCRKEAHWGKSNKPA